MVRFGFRIINLSRFRDQTGANKPQFEGSGWIDCRASELGLNRLPIVKGRGLDCSAYGQPWAWAVMENTWDDIYLKSHGRLVIELSTQRIDCIEPLILLSLHPWSKPNKTPFGAWPREFRNWRSVRLAMARSLKGNSLKQSSAFKSQWKVRLTT